MGTKTGWAERRIIGFVTRRDLSNLPAGIGTADDVAVYLPMSYMIGGYLMVVHRTAVQPVDISVEDVLYFTLTADITGTRGRWVPANSEPEKSEK